MWRQRVWRGSSKSAQSFVWREGSGAILSGSRPYGYSPNHKQSSARNPDNLVPSTNELNPNTSEEPTEHLWEHFIWGKLWKELWSVLQPTPRGRSWGFGCTLGAVVMSVFLYSLCKYKITTSFLLWNLWRFHNKRMEIPWNHFCAVRICSGWLNDAWFFISGWTVPVKIRDSK